MEKAASHLHSVSQDFKDIFTLAAFVKKYKAQMVTLWIKTEQNVRERCDNDEQLFSNSKPRRKWSFSFSWPTALWRKDTHTPPKLGNGLLQLTSAIGIFHWEWGSTATLWKKLLGSIQRYCKLHVFSDISLLRKTPGFGKDEILSHPPCPALLWRGMEISQNGFGKTTFDSTARIDR